MIYKPAKVEYKLRQLQAWNITQKFISRPCQQNSWTSTHKILFWLLQLFACLNNGFMVNWQGWFSILSLLNFLFPDAIVFMLITAKRKRPITCGKFFKGNNSILTFMFCIEFSIFNLSQKKTLEGMKFKTFSFCSNNK